MYLAILAGGAGTRLWPLSRAGRPKQFLPLVSSRSPLEETVARSLELVEPQRLLILANLAHREIVEPLLPPGGRAIYEPCRRGTAPCLGLAALLIDREAPREVMVAVPADNWIAENQPFARDLRRAAALARRGGLVVVGTEPSYPAAVYGYIKPVGRSATPRGRWAFPVGAFVEKPDPAQAAALCSQGWLWNAGIFAFRPGELLGEIRRRQPTLGMTLARLASVPDGPDYDAALAAAWRTLPLVSLEEAILAQVPQRFLVVRGEHRWTDLGTWEAIRRGLLAGGLDNAVFGGALVRQSRNCLVRSEGGRFMAVVGVSDLTVVDTPDALLVLGPGGGEVLREVVEYLRRGKADLL